MPLQTDVPLSVFSGLNTELAPVDIPEGVSPDNQDVCFLPGSVFSRPCTHKILNPTLSNSPTVMYVKTTLLPNGNPLTLFLDSNGILYQEDPINAPGIAVQISTLAAGVRGFSATIDGVEYIAFHDGIHGIDTPRQLNLGNFDRISQDGVGAPPTSAADSLVTVNITSVTLSNLATIAASPTGATEAGNVVTITTTGAHGLAGPGVFINIQGVTVAGYNGGTFQVGQIINSTSFTVTNAGTGLAASGSGTIGLAQVTVVTASNHGLNVGDAVVIQGNNGSFNNGANTTSGVPTPAYWTVIQVVNATTFVFGLTGPSGTINTTTLTNGTNSGTVQIGGLIAAGTHQLCVSFLYRSGYISKPSPPISFTSVGNKRVVVTGIPTGPANLVVGRILEMTGAGGSNFFYMLQNAIVPGNSLLFNDALAPPTIVNATLIPDNTTTTFTLNIPDNTLFAAIGADIPGNNLFALHKLQPCAGMFEYASRLWAWGEWNNVDGFLNMGFEGGIITANQPLGWTVTGTGGALVSNPVNTGLAWQITGDGSGTNKGTLTQTAYQNYLDQFILQPNTQYSARIWAKVSTTGLSGNIEVQISSVTTGLTLIAFFPANSLSTNGGFATAVFQSGGVATPTPAVLPSDLLLSVFENGLNNGATVTIDELMVYFTSQPYRDNTFRVSYVNNFESFDGVTGVLGPAEDPTPLRCAFTIRNTMYFHTAERLHETRDNGVSEPAADGGWVVDETAKVGAMSLNSVSTGEGWAMTLSNGASGLGLYIFDGGGPYKISQEIQTIFDGMNKAGASTAWIVNDPVARRCYCSIPTGSATFPNLIPVLDYRELDQPGQIAGSPTIHISFTGKMIASDLVRKWTRWNLTLNCGSLVTRAGNTVQFIVGAGNGQAPGTASGFGNFYFFDPNKFTDDDYGQMSPYYTTYFYVSHDLEQALQFGSHRKIFDYLTTRVIGTGNLAITPLMDELDNPQRSLRTMQLATQSFRDFERRLAGSGNSLIGERCAFKFTVAPLSAQTDVQLNLQKVVITLREAFVPLQGPR